jgi:ribosomal-protein-alanine N-acetyltransferase
VRSARQRGYASHAATLLARWAVCRAGRARVEALVEPADTASIRVVEAAGFRREGLLRSYLALATRRADAFMYSLLPGDVD